MEDVRCQTVCISEPAICEVEGFNVEIAGLFNTENTLHQIHGIKVKALAIAVFEDHGSGWFGGIGTNTF